MIKKVITEFQGKKTYCVALALICYAVLGVYTGQFSQTEAVTLVLNGLGLGALRAGISKV